MDKSEMPYDCKTIYLVNMYIPKEFHLWSCMMCNDVKTIHFKEKNIYLSYYFGYFYLKHIFSNCQAIL